MSIELLKTNEPQQTLPDSTTVDARYARDLIQGALEKGYDINRLLKSSGISPWLLHDPKGRVSFRQIADLSAGLSDLMNDEFYGLVEKPQRNGTFKYMCYSALSADTAYEALAMFCEYMNLYENTWSHELVSTENEVIYRPIQRRGFRLAHPLALEFLLSSLYRTLCWMSNSQLPLKSVSFTTPQAIFATPHRFMFYNAPLNFAQTQSSLIFPSHALSNEIVRDSRELKDFLKRTPLTLLTQIIPIEDITSRVRTFLERQLMREKKLPSIEETSEHLMLHPQTLRRKLIKENSNFSDIKTETRRDLAIRMVHEGKLKMSDISEHLGFSEPSAFVRAFKLWTGLTPKNYQLRLERH